MRRTLAIALLPICLLVCACEDIAGQEQQAASGRQAARVVRVIDGDTVEVEIAGGRERLRYIGIDTPETLDPGRPDGCFGEEASEFNRRLVEGKRVELEKDTRDRDDFGRLLRYVYLNGELVNERIVREGYGYSVAYRPDVARQAQIDAAQREAREAGRGLWSACPDATLLPTPTAPIVVLTPAPGSACPEGCVEPPQGCQVKGNINSAGDKIYHLPDMASYRDTVVSPDRGERWFCTAGEAEANGWRAPRG